MASCFNHGEREAAARCAVCGKGVCEECVIRSNGLAFCSESCKEKGSAMAGRSNDVLAEKSKTNSATLVRKLIYLFVVLAAVAAAYFFYVEHQKKIEPKLKSNLQSVEQGAADFVKNVKKAIPKSSEMKRQKEKLVK
jgi:uncharacterized protein HemX